MSQVQLHLTREVQLGKAFAGDLLGRQIDILLKSGAEWSDIPADLRGCAWLQRYAGEVANGGHSQFLANALVTLGDAGAQAGLEWAIDGARYIAMEGLADLAQQALDWVNANPAEARAQTGATGGRAAALDPLDRAYLRLDRGDAAAFDAALRGADPDLARNLARKLGVGTKLTDLVPLHSVPLHLALICHQPVRIVPRIRFDDAVRAQVEGTTAAEVGRFRKAHKDVLSLLPAPWFCAALLATRDTLRDEDWVAVWGDPFMSKAKPPADVQLTMGLSDGRLRDITIMDDAVLVAPPRLASYMASAAPAPPPTTGFPARLFQKRSVSKAVQSAVDDGDRSGRGDTAPLADGQALHTTFSATCLAEALAQFALDNALPEFSHLRLVRANLGDAPRLEWRFHYTNLTRPATVHVIQTENAVVLRRDNEDTITRFQVADLRVRADQL